MITNSMSKSNLSVSFEDKIIKNMDLERGLVKRSTFINAILTEYFIKKSAEKNLSVTSQRVPNSQQGKKETIT